MFDQDYGDELYQRPMRESPTTRQRRLQRERKEQTEKQQMMEIAISLLICFYLFINLMLYRSETNCGNFKTWLLWSMLFYTFDVIQALNQLMYIKKSGRESIWFLLCMYIILIGNTGWYIYGNVLFYQNKDLCGISTVNYTAPAIKLTQAMFVMIVIGYCTMCKCCCITTFLCIAVPCLIRMYRQAHRPNWEQAGPQLLRRLATGKFQPPDQETGEEAPSCIVCMVEYSESDTVITLPCDKRHYFHEECIKEWLQRNNACPLCKKPITEEDLKKQKRELQRNAASA